MDLFSRVDRAPRQRVQAPSSLQPGLNNAGNAVNGEHRVLRISHKMIWRYGGVNKLSIFVSKKKKKAFCWDEKGGKVESPGRPS